MQGFWYLGRMKVSKTWKAHKLYITIQKTRRYQGVASKAHRIEVSFNGRERSGGQAQVWETVLEADL